MITLIKEMFIFCGIVVRGKSIVSSELTGSWYEHTHVEKDQVSQKERGTIRLISLQHVHRVKYKRWYMLNKKKYTYEVKVLIDECEKEVMDIPAFHIPQLCSNIFNVTEYPHICAINACLDKIIHLHFHDEK